MDSVDELRTKLEKIGLPMYGYWNSKYLKNIDQWSKPVYTVKIEKDVFLEARDGVRLCTNIFRPEAPGKFPTIVAASGYSKDIQTLDIPPLSFDSYIFDHTIEAGDVNFFVQRGYAYVILDLRGTGKSEGEWYGIYNRKEAEDSADTIEWSAKQEWCDGNIGMGGISWYGSVQLITAEHNPKHLKAIFPSEIIGNLYKRAYHEGILWPQYWDLENKIAVNNSRLVAEMELGKEGLQKRVDERLSDPDISHNSYYTKVLIAPRNHSYFADVLLHPHDGPYWQERSPETLLENIKVPVYLSGPWSMGGATSDPEFNDAPLNMYANERLNTKKIVLMYGTRYSYFLPPIELNGDMLRWYDYYLKGIDTGIADEPPIRIFVVGANRFRYEYEWPLSRTKWTKFYLHRFGRLLPEPENTKNLPPDPLVHRPPSISSQVDSLVYITDPLSKTTEVTGNTLLHLYCSIDQPDGNFIVTLSDVSADGSRNPISKGYLKASHRTLDPKKTKPHYPVHDHNKSVNVEPGRIYDYDIVLASISYNFLAGHSIGISIAAADPTPLKVLQHKMSIMGHLPSARLTYYKVYRDSEYASHIQVPVIPNTDPKLWIGE